MLKTRILIISALTVAGAIYLSADSEPLGSAATRGVKRVRVAQVEHATESRELRFSGVTRSERRARLSFAMGGRLTARPVEVGDRIRKGEVLARLDDRELRNAVVMAEGALAEIRARRAQVERDVERARRLVEAKAATEEELERTRAGLEAVQASEVAARAQLGETQRRLEETRLEAPYSGTVTEVLFEPGEYASPGRPIVILSGDGDLELEVEVPESVVPRIREGEEVRLEVPLAGTTVNARIESVGRIAAGPGRLFPVVAKIPADSGVVVGATAELALALESDAALAVPVEAVVNPGGRRPALFRVGGQRGEDRVTKLYVEVGSLLGDRVVIRTVDDASLAVGDRVVVGGQRGLLDGESVEVEE